MEPDGPFATFWAAYPRKVNKAGALKAWTARLRDGTMDAAEVMTALDNYVKRVAGKELEYVLHPATFLGPALRWKDYLVHGPKYVPAAKADDDLAWKCGGCGAEHRSTAATCPKCGWQRE